MDDMSSSYSERKAKGNLMLGSLLFPIKTASDRLGATLVLRGDPTMSDEARTRLVQFWRLAGVALS